MLMHHYIRPPLPIHPSIKMLEFQFPNENQINVMSPMDNDGMHRKILQAAVSKMRLYSDK